MRNDFIDLHGVGITAPLITARSHKKFKSSTESPHLESEEELSARMGDVLTNS